MTRQFLHLIVAPVFVLVVWFPGTLPAGGIRVGVVGDQTGTTDLARSYRILARGVETLGKERVDLVLHVGDLLESTRREEEIREDFSKAAAILSSLHRPWYITPGDHDVNPGDWVADSADRSREQLFRELLGPVVPPAANRLYYSFNHGGYHFVALNAMEHLHTDPRWGNVFLARISAEQLAWLKTDLERHRHAAGTIVFMHQPLWYNMAGWLPVHRVLREHGVLAVLAGHFHYDQDDGVVDGIRYLVIGATGASVKTASADAGGMHQVAVLDLEGGTLRCRLLDAESGREIRFTPRADADRIQALDYTLGTLHGFAERHRVYLKDSRPVGDCATGTSAEMVLPALGNPIDLPVRVEIDLAPGPFAFAAPRFEDGLCTGKSSAGRCTLPPGKGMAVSNVSTASFCFPICPGPDALRTAAIPGAARQAFWSASVVPAAQHRPRPGDRVRFRVTLRFQGEQGELSVFRDLESAPLAQCAAPSG